MAQATDLPTTSRFHNLSNGQLADALGHSDAVLKGAEVECKALKDEIKQRGLLEAAGDNFAIRVSEQISGRLDVRHACSYALANKGHDTKALQVYLGHRNIRHTVRYTELSPTRFKNFWQH
jgi:hypothetical protein